MVAVARAESQASLVICFSLFGGMGWLYALSVESIPINLRMNDEVVVRTEFAILLEWAVGED